MTKGFDGLLVIDKPSGITSRDAVDRALAWFPRKTRIGHTGTLDPLASGVLVLCIGSATRLTEYVQAMGKTYRAGIVLGATSDTDDADGIITPHAVAVPPDRAKLEQELAAFVGKIEQVPPAYSAAKVTGRRAYALARAGKAFTLAPRLVAVHRIDISRYAYPHLEIVVRCGKGTYIRSLARDLGQRLDCGGYITMLRRLEVGSFTEGNAISLDASAVEAQERLLPPWRAVQDYPPLHLLDEDVAKLRRGQRISRPDGLADDNPILAVADSADRTVAIVESIDDCLQPIKVLVGAEAP
jgi:tRNA pseudouridine55 synthase